MDNHRPALAIAAAALVLGIAADALLRYIPWGINVTVWVTLLVVGAAIARREAKSAPLQKLAVVACLLLAGCIAWRDSPLLLILDVALLVVFLPILALNARGVSVAAAGLVEIAFAALTTAVQSVAGLPQLLFRDLSWNRVPRPSVRGAGVAVRGTFIAAPALVVFGSLLTSADPKFGHLLRDLIAFDVRELFAHIVITAIVAAVCAGFLRSVVLSGPMPSIASEERTLYLPSAETNFALGLVNLLFAAFVAVQFRYFFGVASSSVADYARRGFFELVWVVALVLPMLLVAEWLVREKKLFRVMAGIQVALVFVIAASAYRRMQLYRDEFGLTRLRIFTTVFMIWLAVLLLWFVLTVLTGRRKRFAAGVLATAVAAVIVLHAINPDAMIVETNLARARAGQRPLDTDYAMQLSDDATPVILANANAFSNEWMQEYLKEPRSIGWRTWNYSRARASPGRARG